MGLLTHESNPADFISEAIEQTVSCMMRRTFGKRDDRAYRK